MQRHTLLVLAVGLPLVTATIFFLDLQTAQFFNQAEFERVYFYSREVTNIGYSIHYFTLAVFGILFAKIVYPRSQVLQKKISAAANLAIFQWSWFSFKVLLLAGIPVHLIKMAIGRKRPHISGDFNPFVFEPGQLHHHWHSLPSGHAQVLFSVATIALLIWPKQKYFFLALALLLSLTRVTIHQHFLSDVIAGGMIGYLTTLWLYFYLGPGKKPSSAL